MAFESSNGAVGYYVAEGGLIVEGARSVVNYLHSVDVDLMASVVMSFD